MSSRRRIAIAADIHPQAVAIAVPKHHGPSRNTSVTSTKGSGPKNGAFISITVITNFIILFKAFTAPAQ